jgi:hypothetical protein
MSDNKEEEAQTATLLPPTATPSPLECLKDTIFIPKR